MPPFDPEPVGYERVNSQKLWLKNISERDGVVQSAEPGEHFLHLSSVNAYETKIMHEIWRRARACNRGRRPSDIQKRLFGV
jgi:hypothetical protein